MTNMLDVTTKLFCLFFLSLWWHTLHPYKLVNEVNVLAQVVQCVLSACLIHLFLKIVSVTICQIHFCTKDIHGFYSFINSFIYF